MTVINPHVSGTRETSAPIGISSSLRIHSLGIRACCLAFFFAAMAFQSDIVKVVGKLKGNKGGRRVISQR